MKSYRILLFISLLFLMSCSGNNRQDELLSDVVDRVRENYAPDRRTAVFDITWERSGKYLVFRGEVDNEAAKEALLSAVAEFDLPAAIDSIKVLPDPGLGDNWFALINVSVGNVRSNPRHTAELVTQVLMGMQVKLLKRQGGWYYIQSPDSYLGWIDSSALHPTSREGIEEWESSSRVIVTQQYGIVREQPASGALPVSNAVIGSRMRSTGRSGVWYAVELPDGRTGYIERSMAQDYTAWSRSRELTGENVERTAKMFLGIPYLWGGTSVKGFDCSGFTKTVFWLNGMDLTRDASQQIQLGEEVETGERFENLRKGDLLFFGQKADDTRSERIVHVGIYLGNGEFIHASGDVHINSLFADAPNYNEYELNRFVRAKRIIQ
jgi:gamma-D-glutamyl-L-lysine dipeptidyl-peptidase